MPYAVLALVVLTTLLAGGFILPRLQPARVRVDREPDFPKPFGAEMSWIAVRTSAVADVMDALGLSDASDASWNSGLGLIYDADFADRYVFVTPPVGGWTLVAGVGIPLPSDARFIDKLSPLLERMARRFDEVQYFAAFPVIDYFAWARLGAGKPLRAHATGESGLIWERGRPGREERGLGLGDMHIRGIKDRDGDIGSTLLLHPTQEHVFRLAAQWSCNPMAPAILARERATGWIAPVPPAWRAERARRVA